MSENVRLKVAVVGAGYVSAHHLRALKGIQSVDVVGIADVDFKRAQQVARKFGVSAAFRTLSEMARTRPDVIHILTPPESHASLAIEALGMGCHVFVEKPMAETVEDCDRMIAASEAAGRILSVNHSARMDPIVFKAMDLIARGVCGTVIAVDFLRSSDYPGYAGGPDLPVHFRKGSYPLQDLGVHALSIIESFLGEVREADVFYGSTGTDTNLLFDEWRGLVHCQRGTGQMYLSWNVRPIRSEAIVHGTRGILKLDFFLQTISVVPKLPGPKFLGNVAGTLTNSLKSLWQVPTNILRFATGRLSGAPGIHVSIRKFYESIERGVPPPVPASEGRRLIASVESVCQNADSEKARYRQEQLRPLQPASVLVTGAGGFLGRALVKHLVNAGESVRAQVRRRTPEFEGHPLIQVVRGDLGDPEFVDHITEGVKDVLHVGAAMRGGAADFARGTIWGTRNVIDSCLRHKIRRMVHMSSLSVLDHAGHNRAEMVKESSPYEPHPEKRGLYTQTKLEAERMVLEAVRDHQLRAVVLRPGQIFGPHAQNYTPTGAIGLGSRWFIVGNGKARLPLVYIEDVVNAMLLARHTRIVPGSIFNIVDPAAVNQRDYAAACRRALSTRIRVTYVPEWVMWSMGCICELLGRMLHRELPLSRYRVKSIRPLGPVDLAAAKQTLGWRPSVGTAEGLKLVFGTSNSRMFASSQETAATMGTTAQETNAAARH